MSVLCAIIVVYTIVLFVRAILSWFPPQTHGTWLATVSSIVFGVTEPVLAPLRRVIPPAGMFDLSFMVVILILFVLQRAICG
jgi:YggT family protein